jgi:hypothetical protein
VHRVRDFEEYGLPTRIRSANGVPFASQALGRLSALSSTRRTLRSSPARTPAKGARFKAELAALDSAAARR